MIPYGKQSVNQKDIDAVVRVLKSDFITQGPIVPEFEKHVACFCCAKYAVAVNSGTSALHIACLALDVTPGDIVWTSPVTFVASSNCALFCGASIDFVDIDPKTFNISVPALKAKLVEANMKNCLPKVVIPVHLTGQSCEMNEIGKLAAKYGFRIIEDASHALGSTFQNSPVGSCEYSDITVLSFHPVKLITTGEGGMAMTNSKELARKMSLYRSHGITREPDEMTKKPDGPWYYQQIALGYNYRMTDIQAALGLSQLDRLNQFVAKRQEIAYFYYEQLKDLPLILPYQIDNQKSAFHLFVIQLKLGEIKKTHRQVFEELRNQGIGVNLHYMPVHTQPYYQSLGFTDNDFPCAMQYYRTSISLPIFPDLSSQDMNTVVRTLKSILQ